MSHVLRVTRQIMVAFWVGPSFPRIQHRAHKSANIWPLPVHHVIHLIFLSFNFSTILRRGYPHRFTEWLSPNKLPNTTQAAKLELNPDQLAPNDGPLPLHVLCHRWWECSHSVRMQKWWGLQRAQTSGQEEGKLKTIWRNWVLLLAVVLV